MNRRAASVANRVPALVLIGALVAGLVVGQRGEARPRPNIPTLAFAVDGPTVPSEGAVSVVWFCSEGSSTTAGRLLETILIANLEREAIDVTVTVMRGSDHSFAVERREIAPLTQARIPVADLAEVDEPGVVVEVLGGRAIVEHELRSADEIAVGPCSRTASRTWYFAGGTTVLGAEEWLTLFNPFGEDAILDVSFITAAGLKRPGATESFAVPRRTRVSLPLHEQLLREEELAIAVEARIGRVVAERTLRFNGSDTRLGTAVSLGVTGAASRWYIPFGDGQAGAAQTLNIANFGKQNARVELQIQLVGSGPLTPETIDVAGQSVQRVELAQRVPLGIPYAIDVRVVEGPDVVVEALGSWAAPAPVPGVASTHGSVTVARRWAFATGRLADSAEAVITAVNVSDRPLTVQLYAYTGGDLDSPRSAPARAIAPGEQAEFRLSEINVRADQVIVIEADGPIVVGRVIFGAGVSMSAGIPEPQA